MIIKKSSEQIEKMYRAGQVLAEVVLELREAVAPGARLIDLNDLAERSIRLRGGVPSFLGYRGFPASICASPNEVVVHGIPDETELKQGDTIAVDFGLILDGWHADTAYTFSVGAISSDAERLLKVTEESLYAAVAECKIGNYVSDISNAVEIVAEEAGFGVVREYAGHGVGRSLHEDPQVPNYGPAGRGPKLEAGWVLAIEPMVNLGGWETKLLDDGWTVVTADGSISAHFEHTVAVTDGGPRILTQLPA